MMQALAELDEVQLEPFLMLWERMEYLERRLAALEVKNASYGPLPSQPIGHLDVAGPTLEEQLGQINFESLTFEINQESLKELLQKTKGNDDDTV